MNVTLESISPCKKRLKIEVPANRVQQTFDRITGEFQKEARIPGFRPGHAPKNLVTKKYQKDIEDETQRVLLPEALKEALAKHNLQSVTYPTLEDKSFQLGISFSFSAVVEIAPEVQLPEYKGLKLTRRDGTLTEAEIDRAIDRLADQYSSYNDVTDREAADGDFLVLTYSGTHNGESIEKLVTDIPAFVSGEKFWLWTRAEGFLPGFIEKLIGMRIDETREFTITPPAEYDVKELAGKALSYSVKLDGIKQKQTIPIDDELAKKLGVQNVEQLRKAIQETLQSRKEQDVQSATRQEIVNHLLADSSFPIPDSILEQETDHAVRILVEENQKRGVSPQMLEEKRDELYAVADRDAQSFVRFTFLIREIAKKENITVSPEMVYMALMDYSKRNNIPFKKLVKNLSKTNTQEEITDQLLRQQVLSMIVREAVFVDPTESTPAAEAQPESSAPAAAPETAPATASETVPPAESTPTAS